MLTLGIDDAGRGPLIGPMIISGVLLNTEQEGKLKNNKIRDSKIIEHGERIKLEKIIKENCEGYEVIAISPEEIDEYVLGKTNLNTLEARKMADVINKISSRFRGKKIKVVVDCPSVNITSWRNKLLSFVENYENLEVICEHKADANHVSVSAASILAKCRREEEVAKIKKQYGDIGSGYPSDPTTKEFLKKRGAEFKDSGIFRKSWATWKAIFNQNEQKTLF
ncbi:MAG: ribonuclease HII [Nanoarchaeota archaeon]